MRPYLFYFSSLSFHIIYSGKQNPNCYLLTVLFLLSGDAVELCSSTDRQKASRTGSRFKACGAADLHTLSGVLKEKR